MGLLLDDGNGRAGELSLRAAPSFLRSAKSNFVDIFQSAILSAQIHVVSIAKTVLAGRDMRSIILESSNP